MITPRLVSGTLAATLLLAATPARTQVPAGAFTLVSPEGRRPLPTTVVGGREMVSLDELAALFNLAVRGERQSSTVTVSSRDRLIVLTANQAVVSVSGRLVSLPAAPVRTERGWLVPVDFINRALAPIYEVPIEIRRQARLIVIGTDVRVPRVAVRYQYTGELGRLNFDITPDTPHRVVEEPGRLLVRFEADALDVAFPTRTEGGLVNRLRLGDPQTVVTIDLGPAYGSHQATSLPGPDHASALVIELKPAAPRTTTLEPVPERPPPGAADAALAPDAPRLPTFAATPIIRAVAIDPGHGGEEMGARGASGTLEKDVTLDVAQRLRTEIERRLGLRVVLTRTGDETVPLDERAAIANNNKADLFLSLHVNASPSRSATGAEVFYLSLDEYGQEVREMAESDGRRIPVVGGGTREIDLILWEMAQVRYLEQSASFAAIVEDELRGRLEMSARAIQQAPFRVLVGANMPAVLVEMGFISNPEQERQLASPAFQHTIVEALVSAIVRYRNLVEHP